MPSARLTPLHGSLPCLHHSKLTTVSLSPVHPRSGLFIISPEGVLRQMTVNDLPVGRSVDETLRLIKAFQVRAVAGTRRSASVVR